MGEVRAEVLLRDGKDRRGNRRRVMAALLGLALIGVLGVKAARDTLGDPVVRGQTLPMPGLSAATGTVHVLLMSDLHVAAPDMPPERLTRIVAQMNRLHPDMVLITGDFISDRTLATRHYSYDSALAPLAGLHSRWGTVAVLGNHDYMRDPVAARLALEKLGIAVLVNQAMRRGPFTLGGLGDQSSLDADLPTTVAAMRRLGPPYILLAHEPDRFSQLPGDISLMVAGHTHCGQIALPLIGPIITGSYFGRRYACGRILEHESNLIVTAGLGTSDLPFRFNVPADVWMITLNPAPVALTTAP